jgi:hypothetical protein
MSVIEDVRQAIQDFIAPELRAIGARMDGAEKMAAARHSEILARFGTVDEKFERLLNSFAVDKRLERLESQQGSKLS